MFLTQNHMDHLQNLIELGEITVDQANVEMVRMARVRLVTGKLPRPVRKTLDAAVKRGELGHWKRDGKKPEVYFHPAFEYFAKEAIAKHERATINALAGVVAR